MMIRGIIQSVIEGFIKLFSTSGRANETFFDREYFQHYGFTSRPKEGAEIIIIREGNHIIGIASDDRRYRIAIEDGEVAIYTDEGDKIHLKRNNKIEIKSGAEVSVDCPVIKLGSQDTTYALIDERLIALYDAHTHGQDGLPVVKLSASEVKTTITKAG